MKIEGRFVFEGVPIDAVWAALTDPNRIVLCLPGCEKLVPMGEEKYEMAMSIGIGAIRGKFTGNIRLHDVHPKTDYAMTIAGTGAPGFVNGEGTIRLAMADGSTQVEYAGDVSAGGPIASVGQRMISGAARMVIDQFFKCVASKATSPAAPMT